MGMNRQMRRASNKNGRSLQKKEWSEFVDITANILTRKLLEGGSSRFDRIFQNNKYIVFIQFGIFRKDKFYTKVMCRRSDSEPIYSWTDLFRIKNEIFGEEIEAVQFMPKVSELTDCANLYWFFVEDLKMRVDEKTESPIKASVECPECELDCDVYLTNSLVVSESQEYKYIYECFKCQYWWKE